jgi:hypothetical protein
MLGNFILSFFGMVWFGRKGSSGNIFGNFDSFGSIEIVCFLGIQVASYLVATFFFWVTLLSVFGLGATFTFSGTKGLILILYPTVLFFMWLGNNIFSAIFSKSDSFDIKLKRSLLLGSLTVAITTVPFALSELLRV